MQFRLNPYIRETYLLNAVRLHENGLRERVNYAIKVGETYDTQDFKETPNIEELIQTQSVYLPRTTQLVEELKKLGVSYDTKGCRSCGGRKLQIRINVFEVVE